MIKHSIFLLLIILPYFASAQYPSIIPQPVTTEWKSGEFIITPSTAICFDPANASLGSAAKLLKNEIMRISGYQLPISSNATSCIQLSIGSIPEIGAEGYLLTINKERILIQANDRKGIVHALQTLFQMLPAIRTNAALRVPAVFIKDYPAFAWRGIMLDVCRHVFAPELIREFIDLLAAYKMNTLHWHLTDDQGWRIEIKRYPALTATGAWRVNQNHLVWGDRPQAKPGERADYGGYYTQQQIKEIVQYATDRGIQVIPEIEMPGHAAAAIASFPFLSCSKQVQLPMTGGNYTGISSNFCAGSDSVFQFIENVLDEVIALFPSAYIHIGGDEVDKGPWKKCERCMQRIKTEKLSGVEELQSYFIRRVEKMVERRGRKIIGWDEILEGGLAPGASVMSWRGEAGGIAAANMKHSVVMSPGNPLYFDTYQANPSTEPLAIGGFNTLKKVYDYYPIPKALSKEAATYIMGAQANVWTEYITTPQHATYMIMPRMLALSEVVWTPVAAKNWDDFNRRLQTHFDRLDQRGINYSKGNFLPSIKPFAKNGQLHVALSTEIYGGKIHYTVDGSEPTINSNLYAEPIRIDSTLRLQAVTAVHGKIKPGTPAQQQFSMHLAVGKSVNYVFPVNNAYRADGENSLTDGIRGTDQIGQFWHGFYENDLVAIIDLEKETSISSISLGCLQKYKDWIFFPSTVSFEVSANGIQYTRLADVVNSVPATEPGSILRSFSTHFSPISTRYIKVTARKVNCPPGHPGAGLSGWIFADEIEVR